MLLDAEGKPTQPAGYYANILSHWLGLVSISKYVQKAGRTPKKADLILLAKKKLSEERAAYHIERILGDKRCRLELAQVLYSNHMSKVPSARRSEYEDWLDKLKMEVGDMARLNRAGLVAPSPERPR